MAPPLDIHVTWRKLGYFNVTISYTHDEGFQGNLIRPVGPFLGSPLGSPLRLPSGSAPVLRGISWVSLGFVLTSTVWVRPCSKRLLAVDVIWLKRTSWWEPPSGSSSQRRVCWDLRESVSHITTLTCCSCRSATLQWH